MTFKFLKKIALFLFDMVDIFYHQVRIKKFFHKKKILVDIFFDVGSHMGTYTDLVLKNNPDLKAYLFEPQTDVYNKVKTKYQNKKNIKIFNLGISDQEITREININMHDLTSSFSNFNEESKYLKFKAKLYGTTIDNMNYKKEKVKTILLDDFILNENLNSIDLIKIDTEGHELEVLKGLKKKIGIVKNILIEFHHRDVFSDYKPSEIHDFLIHNNFELVKVFKFPFSWQDRLYSKIKN
tara:strand:+ start:49 stop:765 length:717 start_codon:yes stop_codon:yes gene_type:complete